MKASWHIEMFKVRGVPVVVHLSVLAAFPIAWIGSKSIVAGSVGFVAFLLLMLVHELGHAFVARRCGLEVLSIYLYPFHGLCMFEMPKSRAAAIAVAWGGVGAQAVLFALADALQKLLALGGVDLPAVVWPAFFVWVPINVLIAFCNLMPVAGLDGATAWGVLGLIRDRMQPAPVRLDRTPNSTTPKKVVSLALHRIGRERKSKP